MSRLTGPLAALAATVLPLLLAHPSRATPATPTPAPAATWDLLRLVASDPAGASSGHVTTSPNFGEQRRVVATQVPERLAYPVEVPPEATLELGYSIQSRIFTLDFIPKAGPTRFKVTFTDETGEERLLHERVLNMRDREEDRRWFDERIDLAPLAGRKGTLALSVELADEPTARGETTALFASPRIRRRGSAEGPNLLFVTIDCLRADHVSAYGYHRPTTPAIDRIAAEGIRFAQAYTSAPMTQPSLPQIFTSAPFPRSGMKTFVSPLAEAGIPTAAVVNNVWLVLWLTRNSVPFDLVVSGDIMAERITDEALRWLERHGDGRFALYLHYLDVHTPYGAPSRYARMFADPAYSGPIGDKFGDVDGANSGRFDEKDRERVAALYDGNLRFVDDQLARVFDRLRETGLLDRTLVVISADHGEELWDHGRFFHGQSLYDELLHVPLIVRLPGGERAGTVVERPVRSIDIAPALVEWSGFALPATFAGRPLSESLARPEAAADELVAMATMGQFPTRYSIRTPEWKLVDTVDTGMRQLFDLKADPGETTNLLAERPAEAAQLGARLEAARAELSRDGLQVRIVGPKKGKARFRLALKSVSDKGVFATLDRTAGPADARISLSTDARNLTVKGTADATGRAFRVDRRLGVFVAPTGTPDPIRATLAVDGELAPPDAIRLGRGHALDATRTFQVSAPELESPRPPDCRPPATGVRVCLWRPPAAPEPTRIVPPVTDEAARARLRALGYVQ